MSWAGAGGPARGWAGPARPIKFSYEGLRPGPANQVFIWWTVVRPGPSNFHLMGRGPTRPITFSTLSARPGPSHDVGSKAHKTRVLYWPANPVCGPAYEFDRPGHGPAHELSRTINGARRRVFHKFCFRFCFLLGSVGQLLPAHEAHTPTTHTIMLHQRPGPMASIATGGPPPGAAGAAAAATNTCYRSVIL